MRLINRVLVLISIAMMTACATPKRGDAQYAPVMPAYVQGPQQHPDSIFQSSTAMFLTEDIKARRVGDMLIVTLAERTDAEKTSATDTKKTTSVDITDPIILGTSAIKNGNAVFRNNLESDQSFSGSGDTTQSNSLTGSVTVTVVDVLANGNLIVQGEKWININQGEDYVRVRGIVRPSDINPDNTILSTRIANAEIHYGGDGTLNSSNSQGWLARFFNSSWMPF